MKITRSQIRKIIREEINVVLETSEEDESIEDVDENDMMVTANDEAWAIATLKEETVSLEKGRDLGYGEGEGRMTKSQLSMIAREAQSLHDTILDNDDLPEWVQSKISVSADNISKVKDYLEYKIMRVKIEDSSEDHEFLSSLLDIVQEG